MTQIHIKENSKINWPFAHIPKYVGLRFKSDIYARKGLKVAYGNYFMFLGMILETSKVQKWSMESKESTEG